MPDYLWSRGLQHAWLPCPSPTLEFNQTHVHWVSDAIQPFHPLSSPSPPTFSLSPNQGLFQWVNSLYQVAKYCRFSCSISPSNEYSVLISFRMTGWIFLQSKGLSRAFLKTTVQKYPFFSTQLSLQSSSHPYMTTGKTIVLTRWNFVGKVMSLFFNMLFLL